MSAESVFICYRRRDTGETAGRIFDKLTTNLPAGSVFRDLDSIPPGVDFREHVREKLASARVVLILIGPEWLTICDAQQRRRLDKAADHVRVEVELALHAPNLRVIPILCRDAVMPEPEDLPEVLRPLPFRNGQSVRPDPDFHQDMDRLLRHIRPLIEEPAASAAKPMRAAQNAVSEKVSEAPLLAPNAIAKPAAEKASDPAAESAASSAPAATKPPPKGWKDVAQTIFGFVVFGVMLVIAFFAIRYLFGQAGDGIEWVKKHVFASPTPAPKWPMPMPTRNPSTSLTDPKPKIEELLKSRPTPTVSPTGTNGPNPFELSTPLKERLKFIATPPPVPAKPTPKLFLITPDAERTKPTPPPAPAIGR